MSARFMPLALALLILSLGAGALRAQTLDIDPAFVSRSASPGDADLLFEARLTNNTPDAVYIDNLILDPDLWGVYLVGEQSDAQPGLTVNPDPFYIGAPPLYEPPPLFLASGESWQGPLFYVNVDPLAAPGDYTGHFRITGGLDWSSNDVLAEQTFRIGVLGMAVPEEGSALVPLAALLAPLGLLVRRRGVRG